MHQASVRHPASSVKCQPRHVFINCSIACHPGTLPHVPKLIPHVESTSCEQDIRSHQCQKDRYWNAPALWLTR